MLITMHEGVTIEIASTVMPDRVVLTLAGSDTLVRVSMNKVEAKVLVTAITETSRRLD